MPADPITINELKEAFFSLKTNNKQLSRLNGHLGVVNPEKLYILSPYKKCVNYMRLKLV